MGASRRVKTLFSDPSPSTQHASTSKSLKTPKSRERPQHKKHPAPASESSSANALPGVQKIKASLRQTRRLLAKDKLAADVRVATERRLKALEADLAQAEQARLERTMATRYHKAKFFERQKVTRRIVQTKKQLADATGKKERRKLEVMLQELRVDLNYVLHYPKTKKYISLFPPDVRQGGTESKDRAQVEREEKEQSETDKQREDVRTWVREQMEAGALSAEPELELGKIEGKRADATLQSSFRQDDAKEKGGNSGNSMASAKVAGNAFADDDFFAVDEDAGSEEGTIAEHSEMDED